VAVDAGRQGWHGRGVRSLLGVGVGVAVGVAACGNVVEEEVATTKVGTQAAPTNVNLDVKSSPGSPSMAVDAHGTVHVLYYSSAPEASGARYAECTGNCDFLASWRFVTVAETGTEAAISPLVLDSHGRPRFVVTQYVGGALTARVLFVSCEEGCTAASSWRVATVGQASDAAPEDVPFPVPLAVDDHDGLWIAFASSDTQLTVMSCSTGCSEGSQWTAEAYAMVGPDPFHPKDIAVDAARTVHMTEQGDIGYVEIERGGPSSLTVRMLSLPDINSPRRMRLDSNGHPRMLYVGDTLRYASCNQDCAGHGKWTSVAIPTASSMAGSIDFVLDPRGLPHISYGLGPGAGLQSLEYATCASDCVTASATWHVETIQSSSALATGTPAPDAGAGMPFLDIWSVSVALDASGAPHFAYVVNRQEFCAQPLDAPGWCPTVLRYSSP
jgi:hypothetical protein